MEEVLSLAYEVKRRQQKLEPLLPLVSDKEGYQATFQFVKIEEIIDDIEQKLYSRYIQYGKDLILTARTGNKDDARQAYTFFKKALRIQDYPSLEKYIDTAYYYGKTRIWVDITNVSGDWIGQYIDDYLNLDIRSMNSFWTEFTLDPDRDIDYKVETVIHSVDISPERSSERIYEDRKEIEDGFEYVLDENGNVLKDSTGNDVKTPRKIWIAAEVLEVLQEKDLYIRGSVDVFDVEGRLVDTRPFEVYEEFEHHSSTFRGDRRALSSKSKRKIGNSPIPFPDDRQMLIEALRNLSPAIMNELRRSRELSV